MSDLDFDVDVVVTYVNAYDVNWLESFKQYCTAIDAPSNCRYRNFDNFQYFFRGIEKNMPWVRKIHLVVSGPTQLPEWLDTTNKKLNIVYHSDFIPKSLLPTFNTNHIEMFLCNISGLAERFLYFNDDMFCLKPCTKSDLFTTNGCVKMSLRPRDYVPKDQWTKMLYNGVKLLREYYPGFNGYQPDHSIYVLLKSLFKDAIDKTYADIMCGFGTSKIRTDNDVTLHMIREYIALNNKAVPITTSRQCIRLTDTMCFPITSDAVLVCFNDTGRLMYGFLRAKHAIKEFLNTCLPDKSSFEL